MPLPEPSLCAAKILLNEVETKPFQYTISCKPCEAKWRSESPAEECWSCGEKRFQWH